MVQRNTVILFNYKILFNPFIVSIVCTLNKKVNYFKKPDSLYFQFKIIIFYHAVNKIRKAAV